MAAHYVPRVSDIYREQLMNSLNNPNWQSPSMAQLAQGLQNQTATAQAQMQAQANMAQQQLHNQLAQQQTQWQAYYDAQVLRPNRHSKLYEPPLPDPPTSKNFTWYKIRWAVESFLHTPISLLDWTTGLL